jgi:uridine kinase
VIQPLLIGVAGGSGSGKSYFAREVRAHVGLESVSVVSMDQYFVTEDHGSRRDVNFDHPSHLDIDLMISHLRHLRKGHAVDAPAYDFRSMKRLDKGFHVEPRPIVIVEGLFVLAHPIVDHLDLTCFLDVEQDQRLLGRILRDVEERDATIEEIVDRYQRFVRPSYHVFVAPSMQNADIVVDFTYRRHFFMHLLSTWLSSYISGEIRSEDLIGHIRSETYALGYRPQESYMPMAVDIRQLAKAYPQNAYPAAAPAEPQGEPRLFLRSEDRPQVQ